MKVGRFSEDQMVGYGLIAEYFNDDVFSIREGDGKVSLDSFVNFKLVDCGPKFQFTIEEGEELSCVIHSFGTSDEQDDASNDSSFDHVLRQDGSTKFSATYLGQEKHF